MKTTLKSVLAVALLLKSVTGIADEIDPSEFYSCDAELYRVDEGGRESAIWKTPVPLRTYLRRFEAAKSAPGYSHRDYLPSNASGCMDTALSRTGLSKPLAASRDALRSLPTLSPGADRLDICYVIGDPGDSPHFEGNARLVLRRIDGKKRLGGTRYVTDELRIEGKGEGHLDYGNLRMRFACGRLSDGQQ